MALTTMKNTFQSNNFQRQTPMYLYINQLARPVLQSLELHALHRIA